MANYFHTIPASDACIEFLKRSPAAIEDFGAGVRPEIAELQRPARSNGLRGLFARAKSQAVEVPEGWPTEQPVLVSGINHRNVDLYHWILNGSPEFVRGPGTIFQTWISTGEHDAIELGDDDFAFPSSMMRGLAELMHRVTRKDAAEQLRAWTEQQTGPGSDLSERDVDEVWADFTAVREQVDGCVAQGWGMVWLF